ncbi:MAG: hypothetical protein PUB13_04970 [Lachnospiraceae bacterium]|nr:hypothetical protein [Lachnospiraceae bacterium]
MSTVILCNGRYAKTPYYVNEESLNLYSIEELCYYVFKEAYLLDERFICDELLEWIEKELELPQLAEQLGNVRGKENAMGMFAQILFSQTGYYGENEIALVNAVFKSQNNLSLQERKKTRADALLAKSKYGMASEEYEALLMETQESQVKLRAKLYHNLGVCAAGQFLYGKAADCFKKAYDTYANTESYVQFLTALKMGMDEETYLSYLSKHPESYEDSLEVESRMRQAKQDYENTPARQYLEKLEAEKENGAPFYNGIHLLTEKMKDDYRETVFRRNKI